MKIYNTKVNKVYITSNDDRTSSNADQRKSSSLHNFTSLEEVLSRQVIYFYFRWQSQQYLKPVLSSTPLQILCFKMEDTFYSTIARISFTTLSKNMHTF